MLIKHILNLSFILIDFSLHPGLPASQSNGSLCLKNEVSQRKHTPSQKKTTTKKGGKSLHHFQINIISPATPNDFEYTNSSKLTSVIYLGEMEATCMLLFIDE